MKFFGTLVRMYLIKNSQQPNITIKTSYISPVHVVLVSVLVDQLSGLFLIFFGWPKKICPVSGNFWSGSDLFGPPSFFLVYQNFFLVHQKIRSWPKKFRDSPKIPWDWTNFFLVDQKKWEIDRTIGRPIDWPKPHGRDYWLKQIC